MVNGLEVVLDVEGSAHRGNAEAFLLKRGDFRLVHERQADIVEAFSKQSRRKGSMVKEYRRP